MYIVCVKLLVVDTIFFLSGLKDPVLIRLDVDNKLSDQLRLSYLSCRADDKPGEDTYIYTCTVVDNRSTVHTCSSSTCTCIYTCIVRTV